MVFNEEKLREVYGDVLTIIAPSGHSFTIRQQNGEDDDILSNSKAVQDGTSTNRFIAGIVVYTDFTENGKLNLDDAKNLKLCDKYFILITGRIFSIGQELKFTYKWDDIKEDTPYTEDLSLFIWDYTNPYPQEGEEGYFDQRIKPHLFGKDTIRTLTLKSGKEVRYTFMDGNGESFLMKLREDSTSINSEILARRLELKMQGGWVKVQNFKPFNAKDMQELRKDVTDNDPNLSLYSELEHPLTGKKISYPIIATPDFFYPLET